MVLETLCHLLHYLVNSLSVISKVAGLPNIAGQFQTVTNGGVNGGYYLAKDYDTDYFDSGASGGWGGRMTLGFQASRSNAIYGKSNTVTPLSLSCIFIIHY